MLKNRNNISESEKILQKYDLGYERNILTFPKTALFISIIACIVDGMTVFLSLDPIMKGNFMLTLLMTVTAAAVLDVFPGYFPVAIQKIKAYKEKNDTFQEKVIKLALIGSVVSVVLLFLVLCVVRSSNIEFILAKQFEREALYRASSHKQTAFQPILSGVGGQSLLFFMNVLNLGTSIGVFLASLLSTPTEKENNTRKKFAMGLDIADMKQQKQYEADQLSNVISNYESNVKNAQSTIDALKAEAVSKGKIEKVKAREALESVLGDSDVSEVVTKSSEDIVSS